VEVSTRAGVQKEKTMGNWTEIVEEGQVFWVHSELGNVLKAGEGVYIAMMPKVIRLGPFETLDQAKLVLSQNKKTVDETLDKLNDNLISSLKEIK
jgi:hypothetical protein